MPPFERTPRNLFRSPAITATALPNGSRGSTSASHPNPALDYPTLDNLTGAIYRSCSRIARLRRSQAFPVFAILTIYLLSMCLSVFLAASTPVFSSLFWVFLSPSFHPFSLASLSRFGLVVPALLFTTLWTLLTLCCVPMAFLTGSKIFHRMHPYPALHYQNWDNLQEQMPRWLAMRTSKQSVSK